MQGLHHVARGDDAEADVGQALGDHGLTPRPLRQIENRRGVRSVRARMRTGQHSVARSLRTVRSRGDLAERKETLYDIRDECQENTDEVRCRILRSDK